MVYKLENHSVSVEVKALGAELSSYFDKSIKREIIWQADAAYWKRHAPILFPIVGKVENNTYRLGDKKYTLSQHGFARDTNFELLSQSNDELQLKIASSATTKTVYPFNFELVVIYTLENKTLTVQYKVVNTNKSAAMHFCIGAHPGFNCPFLPNEKLDDYHLIFEKEEKSDRILLTTEGYRSSTRHNNWLKGKTIQLNHALFSDDALIFDDLKSNYLYIASHLNNQKIKVGWRNYPDMGIWSPNNNAPFICIEPWNGMADQAGLNNDFSDKKGVVTLQAEKVFSCAYTIESC